MAKAIDAHFENSDAETKTETEAAFRADFMAMIGNLALLLNSIGLAVIFTILLVTANTMSMAVRERRTEIAVLKTLGFTSGQVMGLILAEALAIGALGGALGLGLSAAASSPPCPACPCIGAWSERLPELRPALAGGEPGPGASPSLLGLAGGPRSRRCGAYRARITDMLRQV